MNSPSSPKADETPAVVDLAAGGFAGESPRTVNRWLRVAIMLVGLLISLGGPIEQLLLGWLYFPLRVIPRMTIDSSSALVGLASCILFVVLLHQFLRSSLAGPTSASLKWSLGSTCSAAAIVGLMFVAGTAMVGCAHQIVWILLSRKSEPIDVEARAQLRFGWLTNLIVHARDDARRSQVKNNLKQLGLGISNFADTYGGLPPGGFVFSDGGGGHGWMALIGPYVGFSIDAQWNQDWNLPPNDRLYKCQLPITVNPSQDGPYFDENGFGLSHYAANMLVFPVRTIDRQQIKERFGDLKARGSTIKLSEITDGLSTTIALGTVRENFKPWAHPANVRDPRLGINRSPDGFGGPSPWRGAIFLMCDGSTRFLSESIDPQVLKALGTPNDGDPIPDDLAGPRQ